MTPAVIGKKIKQTTLEKTPEPKILVISGNTDEYTGNGNLNYILKEDLMGDSLLSKDITQEIFNNPRYHTSYMDIVPGDWVGLPNLSLIGEDYDGNWFIDYKRNINNDESYNGVQEATSYTGRKFIRIGIDGNWQPWQLVSSIPFGTICTKLIPSERKTTNHMGWLPLNGFTYSIKRYPELYNVIKNYVVHDNSTFTLPDLKNKYLTFTEGDENIGKFGDWKIPSFNESISFVAGEKDYAQLIRDTEYERPDSFFQFKRGQPTRLPYLSKDAIVNPVDGSSIEPGEGLTTYLSIDTEAKFGENHVSDKVAPESFFVTCFYIYAGYPKTVI